jgi:hypothetical protein
MLGSAAGLFLPLCAVAQRGDNIQDLRGEVRVNGQRLARNGTIRPGDHVSTGPDGYVVFAVGQDAFMLRANGDLRLEAAGTLLSGLRLITGALGAVFGRRPDRAVRINAPTVTAGIRGTACYLEARPEATYFCTCHGTIELAATANERDRETLTATRHNNPRMIYPRPRDGQLFEPAAFATHTDGEIEMLERAVGRKAPWIRS